MNTLPAAWVRAWVCAWVRASACAWVCALVFVLAVGGCGRLRHVPAWKSGPRVTWDDIITGGLATAVADAFVILEADPSLGRFPVSVAVSRMSMQNGDVPELVPATRRAYLAATPKNEFLAWNSAFDDLMAVSEVFPIESRDLGGGDATPAQIVAAARALHAPLAFIYGVNLQTPTETEMIGILYETADATPIAVVHARAEAPDRGDGRADCRDDPWQCDARALVRRKFVGLTHSCLHELIQRDRRETLDDKSGWLPPRPMLPVIWPPVVPPGQR
ncbi:MAG: hypothetical protein ACE5E6_03445 [Phycisphaerae bacterium]